MGTSLVGRIVAVSIRHSLIVLLATLAVTAAALVYLSQNFAMTAETGQLISPKLEWRKRVIEFDKAFPQLLNLMAAEMVNPILRRKLHRHHSETAHGPASINSAPRSKEYLTEFRVLAAQPFTTA